MYPRTLIFFPLNLNHGRSRDKSKFGYNTVSILLWPTFYYLYPVLFRNTTDWLKILFFTSFTNGTPYFMHFICLDTTTMRVFWHRPSYHSSVSSLASVYQNILQYIVIVILGSARYFKFLLCTSFIFTLYFDLKRGILCCILKWKHYHTVVSCRGSWGRLLGLHPCSTTCWLCDFGHHHSFCLIEQSWGLR